jgi:serine/threonine protein kinase/class 3 adenylate cyclase
MESGLPDPNRGQRALAAIVLTDAVGFSARMSVDEEHTLQLIHRDLQLMDKLCQQHEGRVLKSTGDGLLMYFVSAVQAVSCAINIQKSLTDLKIRTASPLSHRIGIHLGDVFFNQSDVMGNGVNIAARLQTQAEPGGICLSQVVYDVVRSRLALNAIPMGPLQLKNIQEPITAYQIKLESGSVSTTSSESGPPSETNPAPDAPTPAPAKKVLAPGTKVAGRYTIKQLLGQGGFGISYLAEDAQRFGELCVLKEFRPIKDSGKALKKAVDLFKREAKTLYTINHPQIPKFLACFTQAHRLFIVIEYIDGVNYLRLLQQRKQTGQRFSESEIIVWLMQMAQVLEYLHSLNIMHRDISPENIMFSEERNLPVLIDFGLVNDAVSGLFSDDTVVGDDSHTATVVGKFGYSPPEQIRLGRCYPSSDLYALGVTALVLMTGKHPRDLMDQDSLEWYWQDYVTVSDPLTQILRQLTQQRPKDRFQSAREVIQTLMTTFPTRAGASVVPPPPPPAPIKTVALANPQPIQRDPSFMTQCREELSRCIGPMADIVIEDTLEQYPHATPRELVNLLAAQLSDADQAAVFISHIRIPLESTATSQTSGRNRTGHDNTVIETLLQVSSSSSSDGAAPGASSDLQVLSQAFVERCRQVLTQCVGPMATFLLEDALSEMPTPSPQALVDRLAADIPDSKAAAEFKQLLSKSISQP